MLLQSSTSSRGWQVVASVCVRRRSTGSYVGHTSRMKLAVSSEDREDSVDEYFEKEMYWGGGQRRVERKEAEVTRSSGALLKGPADFPLP
mmetsp:Transcript_10215/g.20606  ORF Transcript_10215/g.20606 Transcript_10215/m.20606 type:complete len:90 (-) Transcript_10215:1940-2209(-)